MIIGTISTQQLMNNKTNSKDHHLVCNLLHNVLELCRILAQAWFSTSKIGFDF